MPLGEGEAERLTIGSGPAGSRSRFRGSWRRAKAASRSGTGPSFRARITPVASCCASAARFSPPTCGSTASCSARTTATSRRSASTSRRTSRPRTCSSSAANRRSRRSPRRSATSWVSSTTASSNRIPPPPMRACPTATRSEVPVGLWRPVELEYVGSIAIDWMRVKPHVRGGGRPARGGRASAQPRRPPDGRRGRARRPRA